VTEKAVREKRSENENADAEESTDRERESSTEISKQNNKS